MPNSRFQKILDLLIAKMRQQLRSNIVRWQWFENLTAAFTPRLYKRRGKGRGMGRNAFFPQFGAKGEATMALSVIHSC